jgi:hypothetical protein
MVQSITDELLLKTIFAPNSLRSRELARRSPIELAQTSFTVLNRALY